MDVLLVANPPARSGKNRERIDQAIDEFLARGASATLVTTEPEGRTIPKVVAEIDAGRGDVVVAMGGDGTFREVAAAVVGATRKLPMGMWPAGTANDQGKSFGISSRREALPENVGIVLDGVVRPIDAGVVEKRVGGEVTRRDLFFDSAG